MPDIEQRLLACFRAVFADLSTVEIRGASPMTVGAWDSLATVSLLSVIEDEFDVEVPVERLAELSSYSALLDHLRHVTSLH